MIKYTVVVLLIFASVCYGSSDCGSTSGSLVKLEVSECPDLDKRCILRRGSNATITIEFNLSKDVQTVKSVVYGVVLGVPVPFALPNPDGCVDSGLKCPLATGGPYTYVNTLPVEKKYPKVTVDVKWELKDEAGNIILCVLIPSKVQ